jgi:hypothetical protein
MHRSLPSCSGRMTTPTRRRAMHALRRVVIKSRRTTSSREARCWLTERDVRYDSRRSCDVIPPADCTGAGPDHDQQSWRMLHARHRDPARTTKSRPRRLTLRFAPSDDVNDRWGADAPTAMDERSQGECCRPPPMRLAEVTRSILRARNHARCKRSLGLGNDRSTRES